VNGLPDRVALESNGFIEQTRMRWTWGGAWRGCPSAMCLPRQWRDERAEQENIPPLPLVRAATIFEHPENGQK